MHLEHHLVGGYVRYISPYIIIIIIIAQGHKHHGGGRGRGGGCSNPHSDNSAIRT